MIVGDNYFVVYGFVCEEIVNIWYVSFGILFLCGEIVYENRLWWFLGVLLLFVYYYEFFYYYDEFVKCG